jgi:hypothetical protein
VIDGPAAVTGLAAAVPPGEADAGIEGDCGPWRNGIRTARFVEGTYLGSLATFTVSVKKTDPE